MVQFATKHLSTWHDLRIAILAHLFFMRLIKVN